MTDPEAEGVRPNDGLFLETHKAISGRVSCIPSVISFPARGYVCKLATRAELDLSALLCLPKLEAYLSLPTVA